MRDRHDAKKSNTTIGNPVTSIANNFPSPPLFRAMANTLVDHGVDPFNVAEVIVTLVASGFSANDIHANFDSAVTMTAMRQRNNARKHEQW